MNNAAEKRKKCSFTNLKAQRSGLATNAARPYRRLKEWLPIIQDVQLPFVFMIGLLLPTAGRVERVLVKGDVKAPVRRSGTALPKRPSEYVRVVFARPDSEKGFSMT
jgi:hypothetical protein